jgi:hypothetical protein
MTLADRCAYAHMYAQIVVFLAKPLQIAWAGQDSNLRPWD